MNAARLDSLAQRHTIAIVIAGLLINAGAIAAKLTVPALDCRGGHAKVSTTQFQPESSNKPLRLACSGGHIHAVMDGITYSSFEGK